MNLSLYVKKKPTTDQNGFLSNTLVKTLRDTKYEIFLPGSRQTDNQRAAKKSASLFELRRKRHISFKGGDNESIQAGRRKHSDQDVKALLQKMLDITQSRSQSLHHSHNFFKARPLNRSLNPVPTRPSLMKTEKMKCKTFFLGLEQIQPDTFLQPTVSPIKSFYHSKELSTLKPSNKKSQLHKNLLKTGLHKKRVLINCKTLEDISEYAGERPLQPWEIEPEEGEFLSPKNATDFSLFHH